MIWPFNTVINWPFEYVTIVVSADYFVTSHKLTPIFEQVYQRGPEFWIVLEKLTSINIGSFSVRLRCLYLFLNRGAHILTRGEEDHFYVCTQTRQQKRAQLTRFFMQKNSFDVLGVLTYSRSERHRWVSHYGRIEFGCEDVENVKGALHERLRRQHHAEGDLFEQ